MPTDATGAPTSLGIRKYNTSVDAPSGLGFNGAMDDIDALLVARVTKPAGIVSGEVPVWNGATWVRSSVTQLGTTSIGTGTPAAGKYVDGASGAWTALATSTTYRKATAKAVNTTVAATDLLNGEITVGAGVLGTTGLLRLTAIGDYLQNSGGAAAPPRFQLLLGGTTLLDTGTSGTHATTATRMGWRIIVEIMNQGAAAAQVSNLQIMVSLQSGAATTNLFTTGNGRYEAESVANLIYGEGENQTTVNTAVSAALVLNVINGSASATYETKLLGALVEII